MPSEMGTLTLEQQIQVLINEIVGKLRTGGGDCCVAGSKKSGTCLIVDSRGVWLADRGSGDSAYDTFPNPTIDDLLVEYLFVTQAGSCDSLDEGMALALSLPDLVRYQREEILKEFIAVLQKAATELPNRTASK